MLLEMGIFSWCEWRAGCRVVFGVLTSTVLLHGRAVLTLATAWLTHCWEWPGREPCHGINQLQPVVHTPMRWQS